MPTTLAERRSDGELQGIVRVSEEIKAIVATAFAVNLMAMNAIFLAKRAGHAALGFGVLSHELRNFAVELTEHMTHLRDMTSGSVKLVSDRVRQSRMRELLARLDNDPATDAGRLVAAAVACQASKQSRCEQQLRELQRRLRAVLADVRQHVELGGVLARSAKIEAAYGGTFAASLMQVSCDFDKSIQAIRASLDSLATF